MAEPNLLGEISRIVQSIGRIDPAVSIESGSLLNDDLGLDSLAVVEIILKIEDTYGLIVDEDEATALRTVGDLARYVAQRQGSAAA
jgi:acyl carrier protein